MCDFFTGEGLCSLFDLVALDIFFFVLFGVEDVVIVAEFVVFVGAYNFVVVEVVLEFFVGVITDGLEIVDGGVKVLLLVIVEVLLVVVVVEKSELADFFLFFCYTI